MYALHCLVDPLRVQGLPDKGGLRGSLRTRACYKHLHPCARDLDASCACVLAAAAVCMRVWAAAGFCCWITKARPPALVDLFLAVQGRLVCLPRDLCAGCVPPPHGQLLLQLAWGVETCVCGPLKHACECVSCSGCARGCKC